MLSLGSYPATSLKAARANGSTSSLSRPRPSKKPFGCSRICYIGSRPITALTPPELLEVFRRLERRGKNETAHRIKQRVGQVARYAIATGRAVRDPTGYLRGALAPIKVTNRAAITEPRQVAPIRTHTRNLASLSPH
jgi:integrase-like protein